MSTRNRWINEKKIGNYHHLFLDEKLVLFGAMNPEVIFQLLV